MIQNVNRILAPLDLSGHSMQALEDLPVRRREQDRHDRDVNARADQRRGNADRERHGKDGAARAAVPDTGNAAKFLRRPFGEGLSAASETAMRWRRARAVGRASLRSCSNLVRMR